MFPNGLQENLLVICTDRIFIIKDSKQNYPPLSPFSEAIHCAKIR